MNQSDLHLAASVLSVKEDTLSEFTMKDTFNPQNVLSGFVCRQMDARYGALVICVVNNAVFKIPQIVLGTPKMHYPFGKVEDKERKYHFPKDVKKVEIYQKYDGTNILAYGYHDGFGQHFVTYKTRLTPILQDGNFGKFASLWQELLSANEGLRTLCSNAHAGERAFSFELYGYKNKHLVLYPEALTTKMLFAINQKDATIVPPSEIEFSLTGKEIVFYDEEPFLVLPGVCQSFICIPSYWISSGEELVATYEKLREEAQAHNKKITQDDDEWIEGIEGYIFYVQDGEGRWHQSKCKPSMVEDIHWVSDSIPENIIYPAAYKALEAGMELTGENVAKVLLEDLRPHQVTASMVRIEKVIALVSARETWKKAIQEAYSSCGLSFEIHGKKEVMRGLSKRFKPEKMKVVFSALKSLGIAKE